MTIAELIQQLSKYNQSRDISIALYLDNADLPLEGNYNQWSIEDVRLFIKHELDSPLELICGENTASG